MLYSHEIIDLRPGTPPLIECRRLSHAIAQNHCARNIAPTCPARRSSGEGESARCHVRRSLSEGGSTSLLSCPCALFLAFSKTRPRVFMHLQTLLAPRGASTPTPSSISALFRRNTRVGG